MYLNYLRDIS